MKSHTYKLGTLLLGLALTQVSAQNNIDDPTGLTTPINGLGTTMEEEIGNISLADFNTLDERVAFTFEDGDGYIAGNRLDGIILLETEGSPLDLRVNFNSDGNYRQTGSSSYSTGGTNSLIYAGSTTDEVNIDFVNPYSTLNAEPVTGFAFTANRLVGSLTVSLYSDLAQTAQIGSDFTILANNGSGLSDHSFFGYFDSTASIASVKFDTSLVTSDFYFDDLNITTIPEPSTIIMILMGAGVLLPLYISRRKNQA
ncbi:PEP-CTERM sorting domain-containing protein [Kiritimatiellaeota bacterium B1221]|nr:PEP-CTERM sorting domain-containing protein [Kiritimatiellaeota bacterium B1221]